MLFVKKDFLNLFLERGRQGEREGEKHKYVVASRVLLPLGTWPLTQACALTGNQTGNPLVHRLALSPLSHTSQGWDAFLKKLRLIHICTVYLNGFNMRHSTCLLAAFYEMMVNPLGLPETVNTH